MKLTDSSLANTMEFKIPLKRLVLVGGGHSHVFILKNFAMNPIPGLQIVLISDGLDTPYSGMLPGFIAGVYTRRECHIDLVRLAEFAKAQFINARVYKVDREANLVYVQECNEGFIAQTGDVRPPIFYDILSIDVGCSPTMIPRIANIRRESALDLEYSDEESDDEAEEDFALTVTPVKPISNFNRGLDLIVKRVIHRTFNLQAQTRIAIVGAGAGGVELAFALHHRLTSNGGLIEMRVFSKDDAVCPSHNESVQKILMRHFRERKIIVELNTPIDKIVENEEGNWLISGEKRFKVDECVLCTDASAQTWFRESGFDVNEHGFINVGAELESTNTKNVFAVGDCANVVPHPRAKSGVIAVRQGPPLAMNIRLALENAPLVPFTPQSRFLGLLGIAGVKPTAVASRGFLGVEGEWIWSLKDWIDQRWMAGYTTMIEGTPPQNTKTNSGGNSENGGSSNPLSLLRTELSLHEKVRCGGCGSKMGAHVLTKVMKRVSEEIASSFDASLERASGVKVISGVMEMEDCALIELDGKKDLLQVQTVDFFPTFISDPYVFGQIAVNHALSDCFAMGADAGTALAIAVVPLASDKIMEDTLKQMMAGALMIMRQANCALVGGHTSEGSEMSLGFAITGLIPQNKPPLRKRGIRHQDALILTKPLGIGVIFAAHMRRLAKGDWVAAAIRSMLISNWDAAFIARDQFGAIACTDISGFGILGHLVEMIKANNSSPVDENIEVHLQLDKIPILPGVQELIDIGVFSSLSPSNMRLRRAIANSTAELHQRPAFPILFDPQTSGGLLFAVPSSEAFDCVSQLRSSGYKFASIVGYAIKNENTGGEGSPSSGDVQVFID